MKQFKLLTIAVLGILGACLTNVSYSANNIRGSVAADQEQSSDVVIKAKIVTSYTLNSELNPFDIKVNVDNGNVILSGVVQDDSEKELAGEIARNVEGVKLVTNNIGVEKSAQRRNKPSFSQTVEDATITSSIKSRLLSNSGTSGLKIHVKTINGVVSLTGDVKSNAEKQLAGKIAKNTAGVVKVSNQLIVR